MEKPFYGSNTRAKFIIYCSSYDVAEAYAIKRGWDEKDWRYYHDNVAPLKAVVFERQKEKM
jgi:hypothetical protein